MLSHIKPLLKCEVVGISHFCRRKRLCSCKSTWHLPHWSVGSSDTKVLRISCSKMASPVIEKAEVDDNFKNNEQDFSLSLSYEAAMEALSSLITRQNRKDRSSVGGKYGKLERMSIYLKIMGLEEQINELKIIHVAGTKGKGSTCTFSEAILRESGFRTGLFTSPHLIDVRERIRVDGLDISEDKFLFHFWNCWNLLKDKVSDDLPMPPLFQFLAILAFKIFISEQVDVAIIEVGLGGKRDSTNVIKSPVVCGVTSLGMDHMDVLGDTLGEIASHKAGIFKPEVPAFTVPQLSEAMDVLQERAAELKISLKIAEPLDLKRWMGLKLSLSGEHQFVNAGLAVSLCKCWLQKTGNWDNVIGTKEDNEGYIPEAFLRGLSMARLSGRAQIVHDTPLVLHSSINVPGDTMGKLVYYLDGAHSPESMEACAKWFSIATKEGKILPTSAQPFEDLSYKNGFFPHERQSNADVISKQILLFNCMEVRDPHILFPQLVSTCSSLGTHFSKALFVPSMSTYNRVTSGATIIPSDISAKDLTWQFKLQHTWEKIVHGKDFMSEKSYKAENLELLPPFNFLYEDITYCNPSRRFSCSAVMPSLPLTIKWLRDCVKENPSLHLQVLVTGSLHLVGDVLKLLRR
ncbi:hypothetical protein SAY86_015181 [Trapa natans]|uniref:Folylpolyglutamate synthase n=1 Tax=Trapa natans TaxID=22666 RepID=A0AAN7QGN2_TRANT|nr:hypothetical protein SAY86_015181 [Trapa natans]